MIYGPGYTQTIDPEYLKTLPELAQYRGDERSLKHLRDIYISTADVETLVPVGERENVWVEDKDGNQWQPWLGSMITGPDDAAGYTNAPPIVERGPRAMSRADLASLGYTDQQLIDLAKEVLGLEWEPDRSGPSDSRREMFDRVMAALHG